MPHLSRICADDAPAGHCGRLTSGLHALRSRDTADHSATLRRRLRRTATSCGFGDDKAPKRQPKHELQLHGSGQIATSLDCPRQRQAASRRSVDPRDRCPRGALGRFRLDRSTHLRQVALRLRQANEAFCRGPTAGDTRTMPEGHIDSTDDPYACRTLRTARGFCPPKLARVARSRERTPPRKDPPRTSQRVRRYRVARFHRRADATASSARGTGVSQDDGET